MVGMRTPKTSIGAVTTHATVEDPTSNSLAMVGNTAVRIVIETPVEKNPSSRTNNAYHL